MREAELRAAALCAHCNKKIGESRSPLFYRVTIERHMLNLGALQRQQALGSYLGNGALAMVMGPDEELTEVLCNVTVTICDTCSTQSICIAQLAEQADSKAIDGSSV